MKYLKGLIIPDTHRPYHHRKAYQIMLNIAQDFQPDEIVILGDYGDFYAVNGHGKHPRLMHMLEDEINDINAGLDELDRLFPKAKKVYLEGNHEFRLERYICQNAPSLFGITQIDLLFKIPQRPNWKFISYGPNQQYSLLNSKLMTRHEPPKGQMQNWAKEAGCSIEVGHIHRIIESHHVTLEGINRGAYCSGWLGDKRKQDVFGYVKNHHQWQMGFATVLVDPKTKWFYRTPVHILDNLSACFMGKVYKP